MNPVQINPYVFAAVVSLITGVVGFLLNNTTSSSGSLNKTVAKLDNAITRLDTTIQGIKDVNNLFEAGCQERHKKIDKEMDRIKDHIQIQ